MNPKQLLITILPMVLVGCSSLTPKQQQQLSQLDGCDKLAVVIKQSQVGFADLKGAEVDAKLLKSWQAKAHLVGEQCQIVASLNAGEKYLCVESFANYDDAVTMLQYGESLLSQCLGGEWQKQLERPLPKYQTRYHGTDNSATISLSLAHSLSKKSPWQLTLDVTASNSE